MEFCMQKEVYKYDGKKEREKNTQEWNCVDDEKARDGRKRKNTW